MELQKNVCLLLVSILFSRSCSFIILIVQYLCREHRKHQTSMSLFLKFEPFHVQSQMQQVSPQDISGCLEMSLESESQRHYKKHPPTHTIIIFISQPPRALLTFAAICAELIPVIFPSQLNIPYYLVAVAMISTLAFAYSLSWDAGT